MLNGMSRVLLCAFSGVVLVAFYVFLAGPALFPSIT